MKQNLKKLSGLIVAVLLICVVIRYWAVAENLFFAIVGALVPMIVGCVIAYAVNILMNFYEKWYTKIFKVDVALKVKRGVCLVFAFLSLGAIIFLVIYLIVPELVNCIASFISMVPGLVEMAVDYIGEDKILAIFPELNNGFDLTNISAQLEQILQVVVSGLGGAVGSILTAVSSMFSIVVDVVIGLIFSLYVLIDKEKLCGQARTIVKTYMPNAADKIFYTVKVIDESFHSFIVGQCLEAVVLGCLCTIGMLILQLPYAAMIGVFVGFTALIPIVGAYLGAAVGAVMILTVSPFKAIQFLVFIVILQQLEGNLIYPKVVGQSIGLPAIWVLTAVTVGGAVMGVGGMLIAVPLFAAGYRLLKEDIKRRNPAPEPVVEKKKEDTSELEVEK